MNRLMNDAANKMPPSHFPGVIDGMLPPDATRTGYIPAEALLQSGNRFAFVLTGKIVHEPLVRIGDATANMEGSRIAVTAPAGFFTAHDEDEIEAFYAVQHVTGEEAYSAALTFKATSKPIAPPTQRAWYAATFEEFSEDSIFPNRQAFFEVSGTSYTHARATDLPPYLTGTSFDPISNQEIYFYFDFIAKKVRLGVTAQKEFPITISVLGAADAILLSKRMNDSGWFDETVEAGGIAAIYLSETPGRVDNLFVFPDTPDEEAATDLAENFRSQPVDQADSVLRMLPAWRVSAARSGISIQAAAPGPTGHGLVISQPPRQIRRIWSTILFHALPQARHDWRSRCTPKWVARRR